MVAPPWRMPMKYPDRVSIKNKQKENACKNTRINAKLLIGAYRFPLPGHLQIKYPGRDVMH